MRVLVQEDDQTRLLDHFPGKRSVDRARYAGQMTMCLRVVGSVFEQLGFLRQRPGLVGYFVVGRIYDNAFAGGDAVDRLMILDVERRERVRQPQAIEVGLAVRVAFELGSAARSGQGAEHTANRHNLWMVNVPN